MEAKKIEKVLHVDDDESILEMVSLILSAKGMAVKKCANSNRAVSEAIMFKPDLIILDRSMPIKDGPTVFLELRKYEQFRRIPIIFLTGDDSDEVIAELERLGPTVVFSKISQLRLLADSLYLLNEEHSISDEFRRQSIQPEWGSKEISMFTSLTEHIRLGTY